MDADLKDPQGTYQQPSYLLTVDGRDITPAVRARLIRLTLRESRGEEADQLDIEIDDSDGRMAIPPKGARISLHLGYTRGGHMADKGDYLIDEVEHGGAPDRLSIRARSANLAGGMRQRTSRSWHRKTIGAIVGDVAAKSGLQVSIPQELAAKSVQHIDQTNESDVHFLTRLGRLHDAVATVKKGRLIFLPIGSAANAKGKTMPLVTITRAKGDQHRYHSAARKSYTGVQAHWHDKGSATRRGAIAGGGTDIKTLKDAYATEADAQAAASAERGRLERGEATLNITLAIGDPTLMVQTPVKVQGFKAEIDGVDWLIKTVEHSLDDRGLITKLEMERKGSGNASEGGADIPMDDGN